jgi:putative DNA primase/helicase
LGIERKRRSYEERTDVGNADRMVDRFGEEIRYVPEWGKGLTWDGKRWSKNRGGALVVYAVDTARAIFRDAGRVADEGEQKKIAEWAIRSQSLERLKAMWTLAKADLAVSPEATAEPLRPWVTGKRG